MLCSPHCHQYMGFMSHLYQLLFIVSLEPHVTYLLVSKPTATKIDYEHTTVLRFCFPNDYFEHIKQAALCDIADTFAPYSKKYRSDKEMGWEKGRWINWRGLSEHASSYCTLGHSHRRVPHPPNIWLVVIFALDI